MTKLSTMLSTMHFLNLDSTYPDSIVGYVATSVCSDSSDPFVTHCSEGLGVFGNSIDVCIAWQHNAQYAVYKCMRYASSPHKSESFNACCVDIQPFSVERP